MIPVRVPVDARPVLASERRFDIAAEGHPLSRERCPACEQPLAGSPVVLVLAGISPKDRTGTWTIGGAVAVHEECAT